MSAVFLKILNMSIAASWLILVVVLARFCLKKAPKRIVCLLWALVLIRLICPFSPQSWASLVPSGETIPADIALSPSPAIHSGVGVINETVNPVLADSFTPAPTDSANPLQIWIPLAAAIWLAGTAAMLLYALVSYLRLRLRVRAAAAVSDGILACDAVESPFILGLFRPRIYVPSTLDGAALDAVVAHETAHLRRRDHWWKPLGFLLLAIYWFNPLCWLAYVLLCRDIELACDEKVVRDMDADQRADYSQTLLNLSVRRRAIPACPLAFGEVGVKERVKRVLRYKKPAIWLAAVAVVACVVVGVCFLTNPRTEKAGSSPWLNGDEAVLQYVMAHYDIDGRAIVGGDFQQSTVSHGEGYKSYIVRTEDGTDYYLKALGPWKQHRGLFGGSRRVGPEMKVTSIEYRPLRVEEGSPADDGFVPDQVTVSSMLSSVMAVPETDPETVAALWDLYQGMEIGDEVPEAAELRAWPLTITFEDSGMGQQRSFQLWGPNVYTYTEEEGFRYYELKDGAEIYKAFFAHLTRGVPAETQDPIDAAPEVFRASITSADNRYPGRYFVSEEAASRLRDIFYGIELKQVPTPSESIAYYTVHFPGKDYFSLDGTDDTGVCAFVDGQLYDGDISAEDLQTVYAIIAAAIASDASAEALGSDDLGSDVPNLTVTLGDRSIRALRGTYSWRYKNEDGTEVGVEADSPHPLQCREQMSALASAADQTARLTFDVPPAGIRVRRWSDTHWDDPAATAEDVSVLRAEGGDTLRAEGGFIYEVVATWNRGTVCYSFYASD